MAAIACPNCGYHQEGDIQCHKCSSLFAYYQGTQAPSSAPVGNAVPAGQERAAPGLVRRVYRVVRWASLAAFLLVLILVSRQSPPPQVRTDPGAAERMESKVRESQAAAAVGQPHQLRLDETELNAFLGSNLALKRERAEAGPAAAPAVSEPSLEQVQSSVRDVKVNLRDDRVQAYVLFDFHGKDLSLLLEGRLRVEDGHLRFEPTSGKLGSLPLPQSTLDNAVRRMMASPENWERLRVPPEIADIQIRNGELVVSYR